MRSRSLVSGGMSGTRDPRVMSIMSGTNGTDDIKSSSDTAIFDSSRGWYTADIGDNQPSRAILSENG